MDSSQYKNYAYSIILMQLEYAILETALTVDHNFWRELFIYFS